MARTKNRGLVTEYQATKQTQKWRLAKYLRLSKDDLKRGKGKDRDDSDSIDNQRKLLNEFEAMNADEFEWSEEFKDDGLSGTDADREDFQRMLGDIEAGKINCVIVNDLARLARDYVEAGLLIDRLFVRMNVRFISLQNHIDSYKDPESIESIAVPITNVMNDHYCALTSKKIRAVFDYKRRNGQYVAPFAPHGYAKDPQDRHRLIVDPEAAEVVKQIFSMYLSGKSRRAIAINLNDHGIPSPADYKRSKGMKCNAQLSSNPSMWTQKTVADILANQIYTGDLVQGKRRVKSYKIHTIEEVPQDEWVIVENTHEAIIDKETFAKVQKHSKRDTRTAPKQKQIYLFSGFLRCADCGMAVNRSNSNGNSYYRCSTYTQRSRSACTSHNIKHHRLEAAVLYAVQQQVYLAVTYSEAVSQLENAPLKKTQYAKLEDAIAAKKKDLSKIVRYKQALYEDWKDGEIRKEDYRRMREEYERHEAAINAVIDMLKVEQLEIENGVGIENPFLAAFRKYENIDKLTREILIELVEVIKVYENGSISVRFKFADEYRRVAEFIQENNQAVAV